MVNYTFGTNDVNGTFDIADPCNMHTAYHMNLANGLSRHEFLSVNMDLKKHDGDGNGNAAKQKA